ncbi:MAG: CHAT domain-containing protein [Pirellulales bacterium]|nr:CHAT domain-containing protein [Pirellulales bacterium]
MSDRRLAVWFALLAIAGALATRAAAQVTQPVPGQGLLGQRVVPSDTYFASFGLFFDGDYDRALANFLAEGRGGIKTAQSNWIDSICYHTMAGECYYQVGQLQKALAHYGSALQLYVAFADWMIRVQWDPIVAPLVANQIRPIPWGQRTRNTRYGAYRESFLTLQGQVNNNQVVQQGGVVQQAQMFPLRYGEVLRSTCLAIRRRRELLGPLGEHDPLTKDVLAACTRRLTQPNHWSETFIDAQLGLAFYAAGKPDQAKPVLERALLVAGEFDHPLTSTVFLELGHLAYAQGDFAAAGQHFFEASIAALQYEDPGVLEEAFRYGFVAFLAGGGNQTWPPLAPAVAWARARGYRQLQASLELLAVENLALQGQAKAAASLLTQARGLIGNRQMMRGRVGARLHYLNTLTLYQLGQQQAASAALANLMPYLAGSSHRLFQLLTADVMTQQGTLGARIALPLYELLLRDPDTADWTRDPLEALAFVCTSHEAPFEHWFELVYEKDKALALGISELARRHRFLSTLPLGGRLLGLHWTLDTPAEELDKPAQLERQDLMGRYPAYDQLAARAHEQFAALAAQPPLPDDPKARRAQVVALNELAATLGAQEALRGEMGLRRSPGSLSFPPRRKAAELQAAIKPGQGLLTFFATSRQTYAFLVTAQGIDSWTIEPAAGLHKRVAALLRDLGLTDANRPIGFDQLTSDKWKRTATDLWKRLTQDARTSFPAGSDIAELVIVPDESLWYVPWGAIPVEADSGPKPLATVVRLRHAPLVSLAFGDAQPRHQGGRSAVVLGRLLPRDDDDVATTEFDSLAAALPGAVALRGGLQVPGAVYSRLFDRVIVLADINEQDKGPYGWNPLPLDRSSAVDSLAAWIDLSLPGPEQLVLPGFHSPAEAALRRQGPDGAGQDLFLTSCALAAAGVRTTLISLWRPGGQTSYDLVREFVQELPHQSAAGAWQRAVSLAVSAAVDPAVEPRVEISPKKQPPKAEHPFFWAGYLLFDSGQPGDEDSAPAEEPAAPVGGVEAAAGRERLR